MPITVSVTIYFCYLLIIPSNNFCATFISCGEACPDSDYCIECCDHTKKSHIIDFFTMSPYSNHDVNEDPIIVLPCRHFYATTTLDGHFGMHQAYNIDENGEHVGLKSLDQNCIDYKPKQCPDCRSIVHSVKRYGRLLAAVRLRILERKHIMLIEHSLQLVEMDIENGDGKKSVSDIEMALKRIERNIATGPMRRVFEACNASDEVEMTTPPLRPTIKLLKLMARSKEKCIDAKGDKSYVEAFKRYQDAIKLCDETSSARFGAELRLRLIELLLKWNKVDEVKNEVISLLDLILDTAGNFYDIIEKTVKLKHDVMNNQDKAIMAEVVAAMNQPDGYNYGGSW